MELRRSVVSGIVSATAVGALVFAAPTAQAAPVPASPVVAGTCAEAVSSTRQHLSEAGAPTDADDWQSVRDAAQDFVDGHPDGGSGVEALKRDINDLNRLCAP